MCWVKMRRMKEEGKGNEGLEVIGDRSSISGFFSKKVGKVLVG